MNYFFLANRGRDGHRPVPIRPTSNIKNFNRPGHVLIEVRGSEPHPKESFSTHTTKGSRGPIRRFLDTYKRFSILNTTWRRRGDSRKYNSENNRVVKRKIYSDTTSDVVIISTE